MKGERTNTSIQPPPGQPPTRWIPSQVVRDCRGKNHLTPRRPIKACGDQDRRERQLWCGHNKQKPAILQDATTKIAKEETRKGELEARLQMQEEMSKGACNAAWLAKPPETPQHNFQGPRPILGPSKAHEIDVLLEKVLNYCFIGFCLTGREGESWSY